LRFELVEDGVRVTGEVTGLPPSSKHGFHIHEFGDMSATDGTSMGGHFNPEDMAHGLPDSAARHAGDMGNIESDARGVAKVDRTIEGMGMSGRSSIFGRGIVVHEKPDDGGQPTGNAGGRIGYGVIGVAKVD
jgi:Cu-Zn family superoxide dismutase